MHEPREALQSHQALPLVVEVAGHRGCGPAREVGGLAGRRDEDVDAGEDHRDPGALPIVVEQRVGLRKMECAGWSIDQRLGEAQLEEQGGPLVSPHRLLQRRASAGRRRTSDAPRVRAVRAAARSSSTVAALPRRGARSRWAATCSGSAP